MSGTQRNPRRLRRAFTLVEVLATLVLLGIVLPVAMRGVSVALAAASTARHTAEATSLAEAKLNQMIVENDWSGSGASGDFGADYPQYQWERQVTLRDYGLSEVVMRVTWSERGQTRWLDVSTLVASTGDTTGLGVTQ